MSHFRLGGFGGGGTILQLFEVQLSWSIYSGTQHIIFGMKNSENLAQ